MLPCSKSRRCALALPTLFAALATGWHGYDFTFHRDLEGGFTYYFTIQSSTMDGIMGVFGLLAAMMMLLGLVVNRERFTRAGYVFAGLSYFLFAVGLLLKAAVIGANDLGRDWLSTATPGWTYALLAVWMVLTGISNWDAATNPHTRR